MNLLGCVIFYSTNFEMKRVGGISIIGPALYYTCHIEFKKKEQIDEGPLCTYTKKNIY